MREPRLLVVLVLCRQTRGVTLGSPHDLDKNVYYKHHVKKTESGGQESGVRDTLSLLEPAAHKRSS